MPSAFSLYPGFSNTTASAASTDLEPPGVNHPRGAGVMHRRTLREPGSPYKPKPSGRGSALSQLKEAYEDSMDDYAENDFPSRTPTPTIARAEMVIRASPSPPIPALVFPHYWIKIPQHQYTFGNKQADFLPCDPICFNTEGRPGINLQDALRKDFSGLDGRDDPIPYSASAITCRIQFPGYPLGGSSSQKIHTLSWTQPRKPITRGKLAYEVAKKLTKYLRDMDRVALDGSVADRWKIGQGFMRIDNMFLVKLISISKGSFQPEIWVEDPSAPKGGRARTE